MQKPIKERPRLAMGNKPFMRYHDMMDAVFPRDDFPDSWHHATKGGPPGCARAFGSALARYGYTIKVKLGSDRTVIPPADVAWREPD